MRYFMLDTNMVSYIVKGRSLAARQRLATLERDEVGCISAVTEAELRYGLAKIPHAVAAHASVEAFLHKIQVLAWGRNEAAVYGSLRVQQERMGKTLGNLDLLIAAHAVAANAVLVTNDQAFGQVAQLSTRENWATDL